jgi:hypothetical protein
MANPFVHVELNTTDLGKNTPLSMNSISPSYICALLAK